MSIVSKKYRVLAPRVTLLCDVVVLAQAWKKAHTYVRRHNWYADTLELDCSAIDLDRKLRLWSEELKDGSFQPNPAWLVPAPKNGAWKFGDKVAGGWGAEPDEEGERPVLRPLAHLGIREQTVSTAATLCLADCIESAQGNTALPAEEALAAGVFSYGNRLYCRWTDDNSRAHFSWGNSTTYSRYFQDYQQFIERPSVLAREAERENPDAAVFIVKLDLSAFYDNVDVNALVRKLKSTYASFRRRNADVPSADQRFWPLLRRILTNAWRDQENHLKELFRDSALPGGLPQGLLASGFLANAYMLEFDNALGAVAQARGSVGEQEPVRVHDYCRYVDDLRLVVSVQNWPHPEALIREVIPQWVQDQLDATTGAGSLRINQKKTEVEPYRAIGGDAGTAARMKLLQHQLSGPFDVATLQQVEAGLNGLLALAELGAATANLGVESSPLLGLAAVARPKLEVRDDTLTRFSAYRLTRSLRMRRSMTNLTEELPEGGTAREALLHDFEVTARRLVAAWSVNPSLVQVLRYALDLFPSPDLLKPILEALRTKVRNEGAQHADEKRVAYYVLAEIFKAGATETGRRTARDIAFPVGDPEAYRKELCALATEVVQTWPQAPWYVLQQASLLLAVAGKPVDALPAASELSYHRALHDFVAGESRFRELSFADEVAVSLVGMQFESDEKHYVGWFRNFSRGRPKKDVSEALRLIGHADAELLGAVVGEGKKFVPPKYLRRYLDCRLQPRAPRLEANVWLPFLEVIAHPQAIFSEENALLHLARCLAKELPKRAVKQPHQLTPASLTLRCADWAKLKNPTIDVLELGWSSDVEDDPIYETPAWCGKNRGWMYAFGRLLRAAATGQPDFTARNWLLTHDDAGWYRGIRSSWQSRRTGMLHTSTALVGTTAAITPWMSALLLELLRWPGIADGNGESLLDGVDSVEEFYELLARRFREQSEIYGLASDMPVYRYPVQWPLRETRRLRVVQVQGLMPANSDFGDGLEGLDALGYREQHRNHTAALLHLAYRHIKVRDEVLGRQQTPEVDLVIFPEFAIHVDDQDLMRAFSDATGAMLFYGLFGATAPGIVGPVNAARWLVPQRRGGRRSWVEVDQGKQHLTDHEKTLGISPWRPYQVVIELQNGRERPYRISGAICYDATDLALAADLRDETHMFVVAAMNKDVKTFDSMVSALRYHMYQHVLIANCGEYGGSTAQAPYDVEHKRLIAHAHGENQLSISIFDLEMDDFGPALRAAAAPVTVTKPVRERIGKTPPAGLDRR